jgi:CRISPR-associated protein (TIGR02584 family)
LALKILSKGLEIMNTSKSPSQYKERVLISVIGMSPAILTETLWALRHQEESFIPTKIIVLTTSDGKNRLQTHLLGDDKHKGAYFSYCEDYGLSDTLFSAASIRVVKNDQGQELKDIVTDHDNECVANTISKLVKQYTDQGNTAIHLSLAGGRKTMGYYAGYALSLFGREQDRLSHVLVDSQYEACGDFYYPTPYDLNVTHRSDSKEKYNAKFASVSLAEIPFVRVRQNIPPVLMRGDITFNRAVEMANWDNTNVTLFFKKGVHSLFVNDLKIPCEDVLSLAFLKMVLDFQCSEERNIRAMVDGDEPSKEVGREFAERMMFFSKSSEDHNVDLDELEDYELIDLLEEGAMHGNSIKGLISKPDHEGKERLEIKFKSFNPRISNVNTFLKSTLGQRLGLALAIKKIDDPTSGCKRLQLEIDPSQYLN